MTGLTVIPGSWPNVAHPRREFGPTNDDLYEQTLKVCRRYGHDLLLGHDGRGETLTCERCETRFREVIE